MPDERNVTIASVGVQTIGSLSLKDVLMTSGTPVRAKKHDHCCPNIRGESDANMLKLWEK